MEVANITNGFLALEVTKLETDLYDNGVAWGRMKTRGYGEAKPIAPNKNPDGSDNPEGRLLNRRVSFVLDEKSLAQTKLNRRKLKRQNLHLLMKMKTMK